ncbi:hypothetical protein UFOVP787_21 [uncultured Caudovirales phage]|uniref:Uncharacterized protein n=1 Tax=uncultured Caudovirales phage TaxID=2100421 RepID=A0A6J5NYC7_9CAUD|nr:hypothetical protein UFOVP787_21 [uncultured Caudovirales phage]
MSSIQLVNSFVLFAASELGISRSNLPKIKFVGSEEDSKQAFGHFLSDKNKNEIKVRVTNRHPLDVMRTVAHEMYHYKQNLMGIKKSEQTKEDEANAVAGRIMRKYNTRFPKAFKSQPIKEEVISAVPANAVSGGGVEGIGFGPKGEPGGVSKLKVIKKILKRKPPVTEDINNNLLSSQSTSIVYGNPSHKGNIAKHSGLTTPTNFSTNHTNSNSHKIRIALHKVIVKDRINKIKELQKDKGSP